MSSPRADAWNTITVKSTAVTLGGTYWLALLGEGGTIAFRDRSNGPCSSENSYQSTLTSLPSSWTSGPQWNSCPISAYVGGYLKTTTPQPPVNTAIPTISGIAVQGQTLTDAHGSWTNSPTGYTYAWQDCDASGANCTSITGATTSSYTLTSGDVSHTMRIVVTATNSGGSTPATSAPSAPVLSSALLPSNTSLPTLSGSPIPGQTLTTSNGSWTGRPTSYTYKWQDCDTSGTNCIDISAASATSYALQASDIGATIRSVVTASNSAGFEPASSVATAVVNAPRAPSASFSNSPANPVTGQTVQFDGTASTCAAAPCSYTWADDPPAGGTWPLGSGDSIAFTFNGVGTKYVTLTVTDALNRSASFEHDVVVTSPTLPSAPASTELPAITGQALQGQTVTVSTGSWSNSPTSYSYQWQDCGSSGNNCTDLAAATSSSYTLASGDVGYTIRAVVTANNAGGSTPATSAATATVVSDPPSAPSNTTQPIVSGTAAQGQSLSTTDGSWTGSPASYTYQWQGCDSSSNQCTNITAATSRSYTLASGDVGYTIRAVVTASNASGSTPATSSQTAVVVSSGGGQRLDCFSAPGNCGYPDPNYAWNSASAWASGGGGVGPNNGTTATACASLTPSGSVSSTSDGQTIQNLNISNGTVTITNNNVTVKNVCDTLVGNGSGDGPGPIVLISGTGDVVEYSDIGYANSSTQSGEQAVQNESTTGITLKHDYVYNCGECIHDYVTASAFVVDDSYVITSGNVWSGGYSGGVGQGSEDHYEDLYVWGSTGQSVVMNHDTLFTPHGQTAAAFLEDTNGGSGGPCVNNTTLTNSLLAGGGYLFYPCASANALGASTMSVSHNNFARCLTSSQDGGNGGFVCSGGYDSHGYYPNGGFYGDAAYVYCPPTLGQTWSANVWDDNGVTIGCP